MLLKLPSLLISSGLCALVCVVVAGCVGGEGQPTSQGERGTDLSIQLTSTAFTEGSTIPARYTCDGEDVSPPLRWSEVPLGTESVALIADDPDAPRGTWVHWMLYGIPRMSQSCQRGFPARRLCPTARDMAPTTSSAWDTEALALLGAIPIGTSSSSMRWTRSLTWSRGSRRMTSSRPWRATS